MKMIPISKDYLYEEYIVKDKSALEISKAIGCAQNTIYNKLRNFNIPVKPCAVRHYQINDGYFSQPNANNCYWAGFIAADGCIGDQNANSPTLTIALKKSDRIVLDTFAQQINSTYPITDEKHKSKQTGKVYEYSRLCIRSNQIIDDLNRYWNITPRKSLTLQPPLISDEFALQYIIGYLDGNGTICKDDRECVKHLNLIRMSIVGWKDILEWIADKLSNYAKKVAKPCQQRNTYAIYYAHYDSVRILKGLSFIKTPFRLLRKWNHKNIDFNKKQIFGPRSG